MAGMPRLASGGFPQISRLLVAVTLMIAGHSAAQSADLVRKAPPAPVSNWSGWYAGLNVGGRWANTDVGYAPNDALTSLMFGGFFNIPANGDRARSAGALGGLQVGYNYQFNPKWVAGLEADFQGAGIEGAGATPYFIASTFTSVTQNIDYFGTVRARLGYLANDKLLVYATGGFAYAHLNNAASTFVLPGNNFIGSAVAPNGQVFSFSCGNGAPDVCFSGASNRMTAGWTVGGGLEYAIGQKWSVKGEYLFAQFKETVNVVALTPVGATLPSSCSENFTTNLNVVRIGVNYKFGN